jgi:hypothetical protein
MLETIWYLLVLLLQVLQVNPQLLTERLQIDVFVASKPAYSFVVKGNAVQGQVVNAETRAVFGEFESTRRLPQAYVIFPREALPAEIEAAAEKSKGDSKDSGAKSGTTASGGDQAAEKPKDLYPFTIDFTKAIRQLSSFRDKPRQVIEYPEKDRFLSSGEKTDDKKAAASPSPSPSAAAGAKSAASASPAPAAGAGDKSEEEKANIEIRQYSNRLVLTADFIQTVIIVNFMP